jgi:hypothetical protein
MGAVIAHFSDARRTVSAGKRGKQVCWTAPNNARGLDLKFTSDVVKFHAMIASDAHNQRSG